MTQPTMEAEVTECLYGTIVGFMLPFFLTAAKGNADVARAAIRQLIDAYSANTATELDLAGRIVGFSIVSMDNLRLSMTEALSDTKVLRYRSNAVTLCRASDNARKLLESVQARQDATGKIPRPTVAAATPPPVRAAAPAKAASIPLRSLPNGRVSEFPAMDLETMKRDARIMMNAFSKRGAQPNAAHLAAADPTNFVRAAAAEAVANARRAPAA
jgi:hypothetical protein